MKFKLNATSLWDYFRHGKDCSKNIITDNVAPCPYCKKVINLKLPTIHTIRRNELSRCYECHREFVVTAEVETVTIKYDVKLKRVGK